METEEYWPMAREYGIWNAAIASLQFWAEDLNPVTLGKASEHVYYHFFWTPTSHTLCQLSKETLFGCFILALNAMCHNTFFCMLIGPQALHFIIYSPRSFDIQYFCIYYSHMLLNEENNLVY